MCPNMPRMLTDGVVPAVDGKQPAARDGDGRRYAEVRQRVGSNMSHRGVGGELEHHDDVLLHLILKHQGALGKETLVRQTEKERRTEKDRGGKRRTQQRGRVKGRRRGETERMGKRKGR